MQTIIGSGGAIGIPLAKELTKHTSKIRLVSRHPYKINENDELWALDVQDFSKLNKAIKGSEVVYVTIGFAYNLKIWQDMWPSFLKKVIDSCKANQAKLVFFDNVYMYEKSAIPFMTENSPIGPPSRKGQVRKLLHEMIINEAEKGNITALIARAADFYGPDAKNTLLAEMVVKNFLKKKKAQMFGDFNKIHTYTYTPDAGKATALLGNTPDAYGQVWHVPTTRERLSNKQWIQLLADEFNVPAEIQKVPVWMVKLLGLAIPIMREFPEMFYQYETDYIFDSTKFEKRFGISATKPEVGVKEMVKYFRKLNP